MDLKTDYDRVDWLALWEVLRMYGVGGKLLSAIKSFYKEASTCVKISGETSEHFDIKVGLRQGCEGYIAYVVATGVEFPSISEVPVVCEFLDVFLARVQNFRSSVARPEF